MRIIVALGNPGEKYNQTRHNAAWLMLDYIFGQLKWSKNKKFQAEVAKVGGDLLVKPETFMNDSGITVAKVLHYYKLTPDDLLVLHDDLDLALGKYKICLDSRSAGHKGVQSIIDHLQTQKFKRVRIGISSELREKIPTEKFVLQKFKVAELRQLQDLAQSIAREL
jgi:peptidyl-tRNA hydrolase, PTH1 family